MIKNNPEWGLAVWQARIMAAKFWRWRIVYVAFVLIMHKLEKG